MGGIPLDLATIIAAVLEGVLYGFSLLMFGATLYIIFQEPSWSRSSKIMVPASFLFFIYSTMHVAIDIYRLVIAFIQNRLTEEGPTGYLDDVAEMTYIYKNAIYGLHTFLGDIIVIYRAYIVWRRVWVVILPSILVAGTMTCSWSLLIQFGQIKDKAGNVLFTEALSRWVEGFFATSLSANIIATGFLAYKIWTVDHESASIRSEKHSLQHVVRVVADSGALYSAALLALLICYAVKSNAQFILLDMMMPIISIAFYMIIIRLSLARRRRRMVEAITTLPSTRSTRNQVPMQRLHVHLQTDVEIAGDHTKSSEY